MFKFLRGLCFFAFAVIAVLVLIFKVNIPHSRIIECVILCLGLFFGIFVKNSKSGVSGGSDVADVDVDVDDGDDSID